MWAIEEEEAAVTDRAWSGIPVNAECKLLKICTGRRRDSFTASNCTFFCEQDGVHSLVLRILASRNFGIGLLHSVRFFVQYWKTIDT